MSVSKIVSIASITIYLLVGFTETASAVLPVFDALGLIETAATAANTAQQIEKQLSMINNQIQSLENDTKNLKLLDSNSFNELTRNLNSQSSQLDKLLGTMRNINYRTNDIDNQYKELFPTNKSLSNKSSEQYGDYFQGWSEQLHEASLASMKSQSVINNIKDNNEQARNILSQSKGSDGQVRQLQAMNEMLSIVIVQLSDLTTSLVTSGRLSASAAASLQSKQDAQREIVKQFTDTSFVYRNNGHRYGAADF